MKITNIIYNFLLEQVRDVGTYNFLLRTWYGETPTDQQKSEVEDLVNKYTQLKGQNRLKPDLPIIVTFLNRFRGFPVENLTQPRKFTLEQMKFLIGEYFGGTDVTGDQEDFVPEVLRGKNLRPTAERAEASRELWFGKNYVVIDEGDFRVYKIPNKQTAVNFGYYEGYVAEKSIWDGAGTHMKWCITRHGNDNLYTSYRPQRSFYFVIDESKSPEIQNNPRIAQYYLSALQYSTDSPTNFRLTTILNDGSDPVVSIDELERIYPKLKGHIDKITFMDYDSSKELGETTDPIDLVNENNPQSQYFFASVPNQLKVRYVIDRAKPIKKAISWRSMTEELKKGYFDLTTRQNIFERFDEEVLTEIRKSKSELRSLERRLNIIGFDGLRPLLMRQMKDKYRVHRLSDKTNDIFILKTHTRPFKYGIYDVKNFDWLNKGGKTYLPEYNDPKAGVLINKANTNEKFYVEFFNKSSQPSSDSFVSIYPIDRSKGGKGFFMSYDSFMKMKNDYDLTDNPKDIKPEFEKHSDITNT